MDHEAIARRQSTVHVPIVAVSTPTRGGKGVTFDPLSTTFTTDNRVVIVSEQSEQHKELRRNLKQFLFRVHEQDIELINKIVDGQLYLTNDTVNQLFEEIIRQVHRVSRDIDVRDECEIFRNMFYEALGDVNAQGSWDIQNIYDKLVQFGGDISTRLVQKMQEYATTGATAIISQVLLGNTPSALESSSQGAAGTQVVTQDVRDLSPEIPQGGLRGVSSTPGLIATGTSGRPTPNIPQGSHNTNIEYGIEDIMNSPCKECGDTNCLQIDNCGARESYSSPYGELQPAARQLSPIIHVSNSAK